MPLENSVHEHSPILEPGNANPATTESARELQQAGLLRYRRGHIEVHDRNGLEERAYECYAEVKREYA